MWDCYCWLGVVGIDTHQMSVREANNGSNQFLQLLNDVVLCFEENFLSFDKLLVWLDSFRVEYVP